MQKGEGAPTLTLLGTLGALLSETFRSFPMVATCSAMSFALLKVVSMTSGAALVRVDSLGRNLSLLMPDHLPNIRLVVTAAAVTFAS